VEQADAAKRVLDPMWVDPWIGRRGLVRQPKQARGLYSSARSPLPSRSLSRRKPPGRPCSP
jgi:hypothetical protein